MNEIINVLEKIGQKSSLHQYNSMNEMLDELNIQHDVLGQINNASVELICGLEPEDDEK